MTHMNSKNYIQQKLTMLSKKIISSTILLSIILPSINYAYADPEENEKGSIRVYPKSFDPDKEGIRNLIVPPNLQVEYLAVDQFHKKLTVIRTGKEPQEIEQTLYPSSFPWQLTPEKMENFLSSQSIRLMQLDDEKYKLDMHTTGKGGIVPLLVFLASPAGEAMVMAIGMAAVVAWHKYQEEREAKRKRR